MNISSNFDSGNIEFISQHDNIFQLNLRRDSHAKYAQWFYFAVTGQAGKRSQFQIMNASESSYPAAWAASKALMSYDRKNWVRVPTRYEDQRLIIEHTPEYNLAYYAYFAPYSYEDYLNWLSKIQTQCPVNFLTHTLDGRMMHWLQIGEATPHKKKCWFIARQHAGEAMTSWFTEGLLDKLLNEKETLTKDAVFYIVPLMNPDGVARGNLRANAHGLDLNRQWKNPDPKFCPEVFAVRQKMHEMGVDFFMDVHGDEVLPYVFLVNSRDNLQHTARQKQLEDAYCEALLKASPEFQMQYGYEKSQFSENTPTLACSYIAEHFQCLSFTLEMPFIDNANLPDAKEGWSPTRSRQFAEATLQALTAVLPSL
jgi:murein tripeptide amidase MpaA